GGGNLIRLHRYMAFQLLDRSIHAGQRALGVHHPERLEETRGGRAAGDGDADGHEELAGLEAQLVGDGAQALFEGRLVLRANLGDGGAGGFQAPQHVGRLGLAGHQEPGVVVRRLDQEVADQVWSLGEKLHLVLDQTNGVDYQLVGFRALRRVADQALLLQERDDATGEILYLEDVVDVVLVHPVELLVIEARRAGADPL